jgi:hypothetical protein
VALNSKRNGRTLFSSNTMEKNVPGKKNNQKFKSLPLPILGLTSPGNDQGKSFYFWPDPVPSVPRRKEYTGEPVPSMRRKNVPGKKNDICTCLIATNLQVGFVVLHSDCSSLGHLDSLSQVTTRARALAFGRTRSPVLRGGKITPGYRYRP